MGNFIDQFYETLDTTVELLSRNLLKKVSEYHNDPKEEGFQKYLKQTWNTQEYKRLYKVYLEFCNNYHIDIKKEIRSLNGKTINMINKSILFCNNPGTYSILKNLIKFEVLYLRNQNITTWKDLIHVLAINTIRTYTFIGKIQADPMLLDYSNLTNYFFDSKKIKLLINDVVQEISNNDLNIYNYNGERIMGNKTNSYLESIGVKAQEMSKEWLIQEIGNETSYPEVIKKIKALTGYTRDQIRYALKKYGIDKNLVKRKYETKKETDNPELKMSFSGNSDIEDLSFMMSGNSILKNDNSDITEMSRKWESGEINEMNQFR